MKIFKNIRGDTIVEVLISVIVLTAVFGGAYSVASASNKKINDARERNQALEYAQNEIEDLRSYGPNNLGPGLPSVPAQFCYKLIPPSANTIVNPYVAANCNTGGTQNYSALITPYNGGGCTPKCLDGTYQFKIQVSWSGLIDNVEQVTLFYRLGL